MVTLVAGAGQDMLTDLDRLEHCYTPDSHRKCGKFQINTTARKVENENIFI